MEERKPHQIKTAKDYQFETYQLLNGMHDTAERIGFNSDQLVQYAIARSLVTLASELHKVNTQLQNIQHTMEAS